MSSSKALAASNPAVAHVESGVAGCSLSRLVLKVDEYQSPNCFRSATSFGSNSPVVDGGTLKMRLLFMPTDVKKIDSTWDADFGLSLWCQNQPGRDETSTSHAHQLFACLPQLLVSSDDVVRLARPCSFPIHCASALPATLATSGPAQATIAGCNCLASAKTDFQFTFEVGALAPSAQIS